MHIFFSTINSQLLSFILSHQRPLKFRSRILSFLFPSPCLSLSPSRVLILPYQTKQYIRCRSLSSTVFSLSKQKYYIRMCIQMRRARLERKKRKRE